MSELAARFDTVLGPHTHALALVLVFLAITLVAFATANWVMTGHGPVQRRLRAIGHAAPADEAKTRRVGVFNVSWLEPAVKLVLPREHWRRSRMTAALVRAGFRRPEALHAFVATKVLLALALPVGALVALVVYGGMHVLSDAQTGLALVAVALAGFYLPNLYLRARTSERRLRFTEGFPDALDMLVVCVEAGLGLDAAIQRVAGEIAVAHPELGEELRLVSLELRAGKGRDDALRGLAERVDIEDVHGLVGLLIQAEHFGTSVAVALREHADEMRHKRIQTARERAAKLPVKLLFPVAFFIFPALFLVILGPAAIRIAHILFAVLKH